MPVVSLTKVIENSNRVIRVKSAIRLPCIIYTTFGILNEMRMTFHKYSKIYNMRYLKSLKKKIENYGPIKDMGEFTNLALTYHTLNYHLCNIPIPACPPVRVHKHYRCTVCDEKPTKKCGRCGTQYCSEECQRIDWSIHKDECQAIITLMQKPDELTSVD